MRWWWRTMATMTTNSWLKNNEGVENDADDDDRTQYQIKIIYGWIQQDYSTIITKCSSLRYSSLVSIFKRNNCRFVMKTKFPQLPPTGITYLHLIKKNCVSTITLIENRTCTIKNVKILFKYRQLLRSFRCHCARSLKISTPRIIKLTQSSSDEYYIRNAGD